MRGMIYIPEVERFYEIELEDDTSQYKELLQCETISYQKTKFKENEITMYVDDDGYEKKGNTVTDGAFFNYPLSGRILFLGGLTKMGETQSLSKEIKAELLLPLMVTMGRL